jgi:hypothetical protein
MNQPNNKIILPLLALVIPIIIYFAYISFFKPIADAGLVSFEALGYTAIIGILFFYGWSYFESKSQYKFFVRKNKKDENSSIPNRGTLFFCHTMGNSVAISLWFFCAELINTQNIWMSMAILIIVMLIMSLVVRFFLSVYFLKLSNDIILNSLKFVMIEEIIIYGLGIAYFLLLSGIF